MTRNAFVAMTLACLCAMPLSPTSAQAFCAVLEESGTAPKTDDALRIADRAMRKAVRALRREHGRKLVLSEVNKSCVGGALSIDENGVETQGPASCTVTQPYCVSP